MFKFGFTTDGAESIDTVVNKSNNTDIKWMESEEIRYSDVVDIEKITQNSHINSITTNNCSEIKYLSSVDVLKVLQDKGDKLSVLSAEQSHSDLLTAVYEGGLKIWESTYDLINYLDERKIEFTGKAVLDLGCGAGLIGILCMINGASCYFQDYNTEVIQYITIPNVKLNTEQFSNCKFYSGDWLSFLERVKSNFSDELSKFDYILTSETIYNIDNYSKLHEVFKNLLKKTGTILLAAKSYYFGVGGGISMFEDFLKKEQTFESNSCWKCVDGVRREILEIKFKK